MRPKRPGVLLALPLRGGFTAARVGWIGVLVCAGLAARWLLDPVLDGRVPYLTVYPVVALASVLWGRWPGVLAAAVGLTLGDVLFVEPRLALHLTPGWAVGFLVVVGSAFFLGSVADRWRLSELDALRSAGAARLAEDALEASEARYRTLFDAMDEGVQLCELVRGPDGRASDYRFIDVNPAFERNSGLSRERVLGRTVREVLPGIEQHWIELYAQVVETGEPRRSEAYSKELGRWFAVHAFRPEPGRFAAVSIDVTDRRRAEEALREREAGLWNLATSLQAANARLRATEERYRLVNQATHDVVWDWDLSSDVIVWNDAVEATFGYPQAEVERNLAWWRDHVHPDDVERVVASIQAAIRDRGTAPWSAEYRFRHRDGRWLDVLDRGFVARDAEGHPTRMIGSIADLTARKDAERRLRRVLEASPMGAVLADSRGALLYANDAYLRVTGHTREQFERGEVNWERITPPAQLEKDWRAVAQALERGVSDTYEKEYVRPDGRRVPVMIACAWLGGDEFAAFTLDITERVHAEEALREAHARLVDVDQRRSAFLAMLSHELRNPLAPIRNGLYLLERAPAGSSQARRAMEVMDRQVTHLTRLIDDLLDVTRVARGKIRLQRERVELCDVVRRTAEDHRAAFSAGGIDLDVLTCDRALHVDGDPTRLAQVVGNLLTNAAKFTPRGGHVHVWLGAEGDSAVLRVRDDGAGISPDLLPRVFEPFVQADATLDRSKGGLGLGLALVKGLAELHGGVVTVRSEGPGTGAEFVVRLPLARAERPQPAPGARRAAGGARPLHVLVIEDNADAAESLRAALELQGHRVDTAATGPEGLEQARRLQPDVVLCDIGLPGMDGFEVARRLRDDGGLRAPLVALSGYAAPEDVERAREAGFALHIAKPPDLDVLQRTLEELTARSATAAAPPPAVLH